MDEILCSCLCEKAVNLVQGEKQIVNLLYDAETRKQLGETDCFLMSCVCLCTLYAWVCQIAYLEMYVLN